MAKSARVAPPNSLFLVMDGLGGEIPASMEGRSTAATDSCIAIGCRSEQDGETEIVLCTAEDISPDEAPAFEATIRTPSREVAVTSAVGDRILDASVASQRTNVRVWVNDPHEPDHVMVRVE